MNNAFIISIYTACRVSVGCLYPRGYGMHKGIGLLQENQYCPYNLLFHIFLMLENSISFSPFPQGWDLWELKILTENPFEANGQRPISKANWRLGFILVCVKNIDYRMRGSKKNVKCEIANATQFFNGSALRGRLFLFAIL